MTNSTRGTAGEPRHEGLAGISVVVPNFNHAALLSEAIASLRAQKLSPIEIIIVDDGSTDDISVVIDGVAATDPRIRVIKLDSNRAAIAAINIGVEEARGRFLSMVAAADITQPDLFEVLRAALSAAPGAALASAVVKLIDMKARASVVAPRKAQPRHSSFQSGRNRSPSAADRHFYIDGSHAVRLRLVVEVGSLRPDLGSLADGSAAEQLALR